MELIKMELTDNEKRILELIFETFDNFLYNLEYKVNIGLLSYGDIIIDRNELFKLAEKLGIDY